MRFFSRPNYRPNASFTEHNSLGWWVHSGASSFMPMSCFGREWSARFVSMSWSGRIPFSDWTYVDQDW